MDFSWSIPWIYHGYLIIDHGFVISTMKNPWNSHGFSMYFLWSIDGISSGFLSMAIEGHGYPMDLTMGFPGITMDFQ